MAPDVPLLRLDGVERRFTVGDLDTAVLQGISLDVHHGEFVAIIGQSGSGKSTLMNILGCLDRPSRGTYHVGGVDVSALDSDGLAALRRERFGFIFQRYHLLAHLSADENVQIPAVYRGMDKGARRSRSRSLLSSLGLGQRVDYPPTKLSGGQQQRVSIARALMNGGDVILADEPTGALDSQSGREVMSILKDLNSQGHTVILVTHDPAVAAHARRVIELRDGFIVADTSAPHDADGRPGGRSLGEGGEAKQWAQGEQAARAEEGVPGPGTPVGGGGSAVDPKRLAEALKTAWIAIATHRVRTLLTMLGIVIGITAVVTVVALGEGARRTVIDDIQAIGTNTLEIYPGRDWGDEQASNIRTLVDNDLALLKSQFYVDSVSPTVAATQTLVNGNVKVTASVKGVSSDYFRVRGVLMASGKAFDDNAMRRRAQVVVISDTTRQRLYKSWEQPVGSTLLVGSLPCVVIGVIAKRESLFGSSSELEVFLPQTTVSDRLTGQSWFNNVTVRIRDGVPNKIAEQNIVKLLTARHGAKDFFTNSSDSIVQTVEKTTGTLTLLILSVAVISLMVGGIGVMNIMLVSVTERTHEIGIRMAVGARQSDILQQFLIEAVLVCLAGGLLGIVLSFVVGAVFSIFIKVITLHFSAWSMVAACLCSTVIGVVFGFLPARNAARLDPINALSRE